MFIRKNHLVFNKVGIIAEIGVNHSGDISIAKKLIDAAIECGADAVKFQTYSAERLAQVSTPKVPYQLSTSDPAESHFDMLKKLELSENDHILIKEYCDSNGIDFCSTPYSLEDARFLESLGVGFYKVASADITDYTLHEYISKTGKDVIIATGMSTMDEIAEMLAIYDKNSSRDKVVLLQCVSAYPAREHDVNLKVMDTLKNTFKCRVGFSDHISAPFSSFAAVAMGACVIEKHFTLDSKMKGPDHATSAEPAELSYLIKGVRAIEAAMGDGVKKICDSEKEMRKISRKSIVAKRLIPAGMLISPDDITVMRPGTGISPMLYSRVVGKRTKQNISCGKQIHMEDLQGE